MLDVRNASVVAPSIINGIAKIVGYSCILGLDDWISPSLYGSPWPLLATAIALTAVGVVADVTILPRFGNLPALLMGLPGMTSVIWGVAQLWNLAELPASADVSVASALLIALSIGPYEYMLHSYMLRQVK